MATANERQVGGTHYASDGEQHWDRVARLKLDYFQGQITKYVERWRKKNGVQDLEKARHFLDKYIEIAKDEEVKRAFVEEVARAALTRQMHEGIERAAAMKKFEPLVAEQRKLKDPAFEPGPGYVNQG